jgi:hypothetical protein
MPIVQDDFKNNDAKKITLVTDSAAMLKASKKPNDSFYVELGGDGYWFDRDACMDAIGFFKRLVEVYDTK